MYGADPTSHNPAAYPHLMPLADDHGYGSRPPPAGYGHPGHQAYGHAPGVGVGEVPGASNLWAGVPQGYPPYHAASHLSQFPGLGGSPYAGSTYGHGMPPGVGYGAKPHYADPWSTPQLDAAAQRALEDAIARGRLQPHDLDPTILTKLAMEAPQTQYSVMEKFLATRDLTAVRNKTGWLAGIMKRCLNELTPPDVSVLPLSVRMRIDQAVREGRISLDQFDHKCFEELGKLHESVQLQCVDGLLESRLQNVKNPTGFFLGIIKRKRDESTQIPGGAGVPGSEGYMGGQYGMAPGAYNAGAGAMWAPGAPGQAGGPGSTYPGGAGWGASDAYAGFGSSTGLGAPAAGAAATGLGLPLAGAPAGQAVQAPAAARQDGQGGLPFLEGGQQPAAAAPGAAAANQQLPGFEEDAAPASQQ